MSVAIVTGSHGLVGSAVSLALSLRGLTVVGVDNDQRAELFGPAASTAVTGQVLRSKLGGAYRHHDFDICDALAWNGLLRRYGKDVVSVVHAAAQPSHDWSAGEPVTDFEINALATLQILDTLRRACLDASFVFMSTNKVYGDAVNGLDLLELTRRFDLHPDDARFRGIGERFPIDQSMHSPFGVSKLSADLAVQEYGRYYNLSTVCLRAGTITGRGALGSPLHGFLAYLGATVRRGHRYTVIGYGGKQVRDVIHASDVATAISLLVLHPPSPGSVYNIGGGRSRSCSVLEAIDLFSEIGRRQVEIEYIDTPRKGDHRWWITDMASFNADYPTWEMRYSLHEMAIELLDAR
jgi:CDP-paratose 2-epimerase